MTIPETGPEATGPKGKASRARKARRDRSFRVALFCHALFLVCALASAQNAADFGKTYRKSEVAPGVWAIVEDNSVNMHLVIGAKRALLIDTGYGGKNVAEYVKTITSLPVTVVNTHGHPDHSGGNSRFTEIYAHPADMAAVKSYMTDTARFVPVTDGYAFELGGRSLSVIEVPGHTGGSVALIDVGNGLLFTGDNNNGHIWLFLRESRSLETYLKSLDRLIARSREYDALYLGHGDPYDPAYLLEIRACGQAILSGKGTGRPYSRFANAIAYDYGRAKIVVNPKRLRETD